MDTSTSSRQRRQPRQRAARSPDECQPAHDTASLTRFEIFLFAAIATVLGVRAFLAATGYPKVGGGGLHVAHVLWGGLFMGLAVVMAQVGMGTRVRTRAAFVGGVGFGLFIDEVGKFLTKDVNYFYTPAVAVMYIVFVLFYLGVRTFLLRRTLTDERRLALAATAVADQALGELDSRRRALALQFLDEMSQPFEAADALRGVLIAAPVAKRSFQRWLLTAGEQARSIGRSAATNPLVQVAVWLLLAYETYHRFDDYIEYLRIILLLHHDNLAVDLGFYYYYLLGANLLCAAIVAAGLVLVLLPVTRLAGLWALQAGLLLDLLFDQFSTFKVEQFAALIGFGVELLIFIGVRALIRERRLPFDEPLSALRIAGR